ncbi:hypothetical protein BC832DRAFT_595794 [Gaertneriomyces semiglobifer]|nr:hypothetical protein BC832DRAFT_595794 [Gaertneriomyces semiglobifer]
MGDKNSLTVPGSLPPLQHDNSGNNLPIPSLAVPTKSKHHHHKKKPKITQQKIEPLAAPTLYERLCYFLDILVPEDAIDTMDVPEGHFLQQVHYGKIHKWRVAQNHDAGLPDYLTDHKDPAPQYKVVVEKQGFLPIFDLTSKFLKRWDMLTLVLLLFTASVTPFETAFRTGTLQIDILFLINRLVDLIFFFDMFIQMRTPYRDAQTGRLVRDGKAIFLRYFKSWFFLDLVSVIPFEVVSLGQSETERSTGLTQMRLLRFLRLARLLKLLRVLRASRKLKQWQVYINMRYAKLKIMQYAITIFFLIHWIACGYRLSEEKNHPNDPSGWLVHYANYRGVDIHAISIWEAYVIAIYWSSATLTLIGPSWDVIAPTTPRELGYSFFANFIGFLCALYYIAALVNVLNVADRVQREHDLRVDTYLEMFDRLKLDQRLKFRVHAYLSDHFAAATTEAYTAMLKDLPTQLHGFITVEIFLDFVEMIPYLEPFIDREPALIQELCRGITIKIIPANAHIFTDGYEGVYFLEHGIVAIEGRVYPSGRIFGRTVLRETIKQTEGRALTNATLHFLPRSVLKSALDKYPKIRYYAKRWTAWQLLRRYIYTYTHLYYTAAKRGARMRPPLTSMRPNIKEGEFDDIDIAVLEHMTEFGY